MILSSSHRMIQKLASESGLIAAMRLETTIENFPLGAEAFHLANSEAHCCFVGRAINDLVTSGALSAGNASKLLGDLVGRNTYGSFSELAVYDWIARCHVMFETQVTLGPDEVLGIKGSTLDGRIKHATPILTLNLSALVDCLPNV